MPGRLVQSMERLTQELDVPSSFIPPSADSRRTAVSNWHLVLVNLVVGLSLPKNSVVSLAGHPDMTIAVYRGHKETTIAHDLSFLAHVFIGIIRFRIKMADRA